MIHKFKFTPFNSKTFGGEHSVRLHKVRCQYIHSVTNERELVETYNIIEKSLEHEKIKNFVKQVSKNI